MNGDGHLPTDESEGALPEGSEPGGIEASRVFDAYLARIEAGHPADPERLLAEHPEIADQLGAFLSVANQIGRIAVESPPALDDYRIIREIGRGGMGIVYEAEQLSRGRRVALKVLPSAAALDPRQLRRFQNEAQAARLLRHAHVVPVTSFGCERGVYSYAMQFIDGQNLADLIHGLRQSEGGEPSGTSRSVRSTVTFGVNGAEGTTHEPSPTTATGPLGSNSTRDCAFFAKAARWALQAAEALDHSHEQGVMHRDIKPSNLLIDTHYNLWVTDFGLAQIHGEDGLTRTGDLLGTLRYMSPEQALGKRVVIDGRTDIYSLGVTFYELLTLRPAFDGRDRQEVLQQIAQEEPPSPRRVFATIPRNLETIVLKAMAKDREDRYATARELADDLTRFLEDRPIRARPVSLLDRVARWARRHRVAVAAAFVFLVLVVAGLIIGNTRVRREQQRTARESLIQQQLLIRNGLHTNGWSTKAWELIRQAADIGQDDDGTLQVEAIATLGGFDARPVKRFEEFGGLALAYDHEGQRLLIGMATDPKDGRKRIGARLWNGAKQELLDLRVAEEGPVGFGPDGSPRQLVVRSREGTLSLMDLLKREVIQDFKLPGEAAIPGLGSVAMLPDGSQLGATFQRADGQGGVAVWNGVTGELVRRFAGPANCLALSSDRALAATGDDAGRITVWSLVTGREVASLQSGPTKVRCLAFGADRRRGNTIDSQREGYGWLLAAGQAGGAVTIWDVGMRIPRSYCPGSWWDVYAVAFSPDGMTLASAGRGPAKLWDVATGRLLLDLGEEQFQFGLAFAPDGKRLAIGCLGGFNHRGKVTIWQVEEGRGLRSLRGLKGRVEKAVLSPDGQFVAGLTQTWQVAIWGLADGHLRHVLDVPQGFVADNAGLAFSPDGHRFAFSAGREARLWDLDSGDVLETWPLPEGLQDTLAFQEPNHLWLFRFETTEGVAPPPAPTPGSVRVCRSRDLLGPNPDRPIWETTEFDRHVFLIGSTLDGRYVVVKGVGGPRDQLSIAVFEGATGKKLWSVPVPQWGPAAFEGWFRLDPAGSIVATITGPDDVSMIVHEIVSGRVVSSQVVGFGSHPMCLAAGARLWFGGGKLFLRRSDQERWEARLVGPHGHISEVVQFSADGRYLAWGSDDGAVKICDLETIRRLLADVDLGW